MSMSPLSRQEHPINRQFHEKLLSGSFRKLVEKLMTLFLLDRNNTQQRQFSTLRDIEFWGGGGGNLP